MRFHKMRVAHVFPRRIPVNWTLFFLSVLAAAVNLTKAVHIDDTAYLEMARAIIRNPLHPLSEHLNWDDSARPIFETNQPLLFPAVLAGWILMMGEGELLLHLPIALCSAGVVILFYRLARRLECAAPLYLTALFVLSPAFLVGQNLMVDMPLMMFFLMFFSLLCAPMNQDSRSYVYAAMVAAGACLLKYTALVLLPILALVLIVRGENKQLRVLLIPLVVLLGWSLFNLYDYGAVHLMHRPMPQQSWGEQAARIISILGGLGAVAPFAASFLRSGRLMQSTVVGGAMISLSAAMLAFFFHPQGLIASVIWGVSLFLGLIAFVGTVKTLLDRAIILSEERRRLSEGPRLVLLLWLLGTIALISASAPFIAIRHVFLVLPVILLALGMHFGQVGINARTQAIHILIAGGLGIGLAFSDYTFAGVYREAPGLLRSRLGKEARIYHAGHWGWQWYAEREGFRQYDYLQTKFEEGDILIIAEGISAQCINPDHLAGLSELARITLASTAFPWLRAMSPAQGGLGFYSYGFPFSLPYTVSEIDYSFRIFKFSKSTPNI